MLIKIDGLDEVTKTLNELNTNVVNLVSEMKDLQLDVRSLEDAILSMSAYEER